MSKSVRLKAYNPRAGFVLKRYTYRGIKFEEGKGWYKVPDEVAAYLEKVRSVEHDEHAPLTFDVATHADAAKITELEYRRKVAQGRVSPGDAPVMVPRDTSEQVRDRQLKTEAEPAYGPDLNEPPDLNTADLARGTSRAKPGKAPGKKKRAAPSFVPPPDPKPAREPRERSTRPG